MNSINLEKQKLYEFLFELIRSKIMDAENDISAVKEARNNDTKSSAGDKFETGRAMMQQEMDKSELQLNAANMQLQELMKLNINKVSGKIESGSLVITDMGKYFISIGLGKVTLGNEIYYVISQVSPVGKLLLDKKIGDEVEFQNQRLRINEIY